MALKWKVRITAVRNLNTSVPPQWLGQTLVQEEKDNMRYVFLLSHRKVNHPDFLNTDKRPSIIRPT
jgi:hypothetical protein